MGRMALLSTSNKQGLVALATALVQEFGFTLLSSGGTAKTLQAAGIPVTTVSEYTGAPKSLVGGSRPCIPKFTAVFWHGAIAPKTRLICKPKGFIRLIWWLSISIPLPKQLPSPT